MGDDQRKEIGNAGIGMATIILDEYILPTLVRYIDQYRWSWPLVVRLINMYYGTEYTVKHLKTLYRQNK